jgi:hypothetical protein
MGFPGLQAGNRVQILRDASDSVCSISQILIIVGLVLSVGRPGIVGLM